MSVFFLPSELKSLMNKFRLVSNAGMGCIRWMSWERLCNPKKFDSMSFGRIREFNLAP